MLETGLCSRKGIQYLHFFSNRYYFACDAVYSLTYFLNQEQTVEVTLITDFQIVLQVSDRNSHLVQMGIVFSVYLVSGTSRSGEKTSGRSVG